MNSRWIREGSVFARRLIAVCAFVIVLGAAISLSVPKLASSTAGLSLRVFASCAHVHESARLHCYEDHIPALYPSYSVEQIYAVVGLLQAYDPALYYCHVVAHEIAEAVVAEDPSGWKGLLWLGPDNDHCSYGFFHGLALSAFRDKPLSTEEFRAQEPFFKDACEIPEGIYHPYRQLGRTVACNHGLGHMFYYVADAEVLAALEFCDRAVREDESLPFVQGRAQCYEGVLMQHFYIQEPEDYQDVGRRTWSLTEGRAFCELLGEDRHRSACERSLRYLMLEDLEQGRGSQEICDAQPNDTERRFCYGRIMSAILITTTAEPERIVQACSGMPDPFRSVCGAHAAVSIVGNRGGVDGLADARHLCRIMERPQDADWCFRALAQHAPFYYAEGEPDRRRYCSHLPVTYRPLCETFEYDVLAEGTLGVQDFDTSGATSRVGWVGDDNAL